MVDRRCSTIATPVPRPAPKSATHSLKRATHRLLLENRFEPRCRETGFAPRFLDVGDADDAVSLVKEDKVRTRSANGVKNSGDCRLERAYVRSDLLKFSGECRGKAQIDLFKRDSIRPLNSVGDLRGRSLGKNLVAESGGADSDHKHSASNPQAQATQRHELRTGPAGPRSPAPAAIVDAARPQLVDNRSPAPSSGSGSRCSPAVGGPSCQRRRRSEHRQALSAGISISSIRERRGEECREADELPFRRGRALGYFALPAPLGIPVCLEMENPTPLYIADTPSALDLRSKRDVDAWALLKLRD